MSWDVVIVGAGAAGLAAAAFTRARNPDRSVLLLDGARKVGAKILVSGGARCNVTNTVVTERDYWGGSPAVIRRVLRAFTVQDTIDLFARAGVTLHEEEDGKLFPDSNRSRDVLRALLATLHDSGAVLREAQRVTSIAKGDAGFLVTSNAGVESARAVVLATGGQSLPKSGSDGGGYRLAESLGHTLVATTPALAPLVLDGSGSALHSGLSGVSLDAQLTLRIDGAVGVRLRGPLLWTHFGISGPVALNMSRHFLRARIEGGEAAVTASFMPDEYHFARTEQLWIEEARIRPRLSIVAALSRFVPASMAASLLERAGVDGAAQLAHLSRDDRRTIARLLTELPIAVTDSRGYNHAEATAGGVDLREISPATMESRVCPGLYLIGEILDVDGRLGGFNFQWAWSSASVAASALAK